VDVVSDEEGFGLPIEVVLTRVYMVGFLSHRYESQVGAWRDLFGVVFRAEGVLSRGLLF
jgi:hypothetical protein